jgi:hypothetical protein
MKQYFQFRARKNSCNSLAVLFEDRLCVAPAKHPPLRPVLFLAFHGSAKPIIPEGRRSLYPIESV